MASSFPLFRRTSGLNNAIDPVRLQHDPETGTIELAAAVNVDIDDTGFPSTRRGFALLAEKPGTHSLWSNGDVAFFVAGSSMYQLYHDMSYRGIRSGLTPSAPVSYAEIGGRVFYANGFENGQNYEDASFPWVGGEYVGPETVHYVDSRPPVGHLLAVMSGRLLIAQENVLWMMMPFDPYHYRPSVDFVSFEGRVTMIHVLPDGVWLSDGQGVYWLPGHEPGKWELARRADYPAIMGTAVEVDMGKIGEGEMPGRCVIFATPKGVCLGGASGYFRNLTERKIVLPSASHGAAVAIGKKFIVSFQE